MMATFTKLERKQITREEFYQLILPLCFIGEPTAEAVELVMKGLETMADYIQKKKYRK